MADPKIRYDILANAEGEEDVRRLATELEKLDDAVDPAAAARAKALATELRQLGQQQQALSTFVELKNKTEGAKTALEQAQAEAQKLGQQLRNVETPTRAQAGQMEKLRDAVRAAKNELQLQTSALDRARGELTALGLASDRAAAGQRQVREALQATRQQATVVAAGYREQAEAAQRAAAEQIAAAQRTAAEEAAAAKRAAAEAVAAQRQQREALQATAAQARRSAQEQLQAQRAVGDGVQAVRAQLLQLQTLAGLAVGGGVFTGLARGAAETADAYANLSARIRIVTGDGEAFDQALQGVFDVATRTNSSVDETANLFTKLAQAGKELGFSNQVALQLTETINQSIQLSGGSADSARAAIVQLVQGLQSGVLRGEEFNSIMEQSPRLARALADGLGRTTGELRKLANQGALTTDVVIKALEGQSAAVQREFEQLPPTVGRAIQNLSTEWTRYIGEADKANGASITAATALNALADNLGTVATVLTTAGQAWLAYKALDLAGTFFGQARAIQTVVLAQAEAASVQARSTTVTAANTAATVANTTAKTANATASVAAAGAEAAAATAGAAASATLGQRIGLLGRFAGALGTVGLAVALFGDLAVKAFTGVGTAIGEGAAKLLGFRDRSKEVDEQLRLEAESARTNAAAKAELAAQTQAAADAALGLSTNAKALVGEFEALRTKGESVDDALGKLSQKLQLGDVTGIQEAGAALDALGLRGQLSGEQIQRALADALEGQDLAAFEAKARVAFNGSEQGVRRLETALLAVTDQALARAGTSVRELQTGFSEAGTSAINDLDALAEALVAVGAGADDSGRLLAAGVNKALDAAKTEAAIQAVIVRLQQMGRDGRLSGEQVRDGLELARRKAEELRPGINSLSEALRTFGLSTRQELQATANSLGESYRVIANSTEVSLADQVTAFQRYSEAAIAANGGVESSTLSLQRRILQVRIDAAGLGVDLASSMNQSRKATDDATAALGRYEAGLIRVNTRLPRGVTQQEVDNDPYGRSPDDIFRMKQQGGPVDNSFAFEVRDRVLAGDTFTPDELDALRNGLRVAQENARLLSGASIPASAASVRDAESFVNFFERAVESALVGSNLVGGAFADPFLSGGGGSNPVVGAPAPGPAGPSAPGPAAGSAPAAPTTTYVTNVSIGGQTRTFTFTDQSTADGVVQALEDSYRAGGGG